MSFELLHPDGLRVSRGLTESQLLGSLPTVASSKLDMHTGWTWYRLPPFLDGEVVVAVLLGFNFGALELVTIADGSTQFGASWRDWSEAQEHQRALSIGGWLGGTGFAAGTYSWGSVWVGHDAKAGSGHAAVRFTT